VGRQACDFLFSSEFSGRKEGMTAKKTERQSGLPRESGAASPIKKK
jgi:hypothetical protein